MACSGKAKWPPVSKIAAKKNMEIIPVPEQPLLSEKTWVSKSAVWFTNTCAVAVRAEIMTLHCSCVLWPTFNWISHADWRALLWQSLAAGVANDRWQRLSRQPQQPSTRCRGCQLLLSEFPLGESQADAIYKESKRQNSWGGVAFGKLHHNIF